MVLGRKFQTLRDKVEQLKVKKDTLQQSADEATRSGEVIYGNVAEWLRNADKAIEEAEELVGSCLNLKSIYQLSKNAEKIALVIDDLLNEQGLDSVSFMPSLQQSVGNSLYSCEDMPSRVSMLNQIMDALRDPNLHIIGVYGVGGVGKTTLLEEIRGKAIQEKLFKFVVMVSVSQTQSLRRIQAEIADFFGLKLFVEDVRERANQVYQRLKKSKVLIILDGLSRKIDLKSIEIPNEDECSGCRVLLSSRSKDVLSSEMGTQKEFSLNALEEEEARNLFQTKVAEAKFPKFHSIATEITKKCGGLPLLFQIVAKELHNKVWRNEELNVWDDILKQLSVLGNEDIHKRLHKDLESIFINLAGDNEKALFLLCALFGQSDIPVQNLLIYSIGLGLFKDIHTIEEARKKLFVLIGKLKADCLLMDSRTDGFVKMHNVVREAALSIASKLQHAFVGLGGVRLRDWPGCYCTTIAFSYCDVDEISTGLYDPMVELFLLFTENLCLEIPDLFFAETTRLKVVSISGVSFSPRLPSSLGFLTSLQSLCLNGCQLNDVGVIRELKQLRLLSFADSKIIELPREIEGLTRLELLDLRNCCDLKVIPAGVISKLISLQELYMLNSFVGWDTKDNVKLVELQNLSHLSTLEIQIVNPKLIRKGCSFFSGLRNYKISIGDKWNWDGKYETSRTLKLKPEADIHFEGGVQVLLRGAEDLYIDKVGGILDLLYEGPPKSKHLHIQYDYFIQPMLNLIAGHGFPFLESLYFYNFNSLEKIFDGEDKGLHDLSEARKKSVLYLVGKCFPQLKLLDIRNDYAIQHSIKSTMQAVCHAFPVLESLYLNNLNSLESLSFGKLRSLNVSGCNQLKILFSFSSARCLPQLEDIEVASCENIEVVIGEGSESAEVIEFTQLSSLKLKNLPYLRGFCKRGNRTSGQMNLLFNDKVSFPNLTTLVVEKCKSLRYIFTASMALKCLEKLQELRVEDCELVEEIVPNKEIVEKEENPESITKIVLPKLNYLSLCGLQSMKRFGCYPIEFSSLIELSIKECPSMNNFVPKLSVNDSDESLFFNEMVTLSNLEIMTVRNINTFAYLWLELFIADDSFLKLKSLSITHCSKLLVVFPSSIIARFKKLEKLNLSNCVRVEEIFQHQETDSEARNIVQAFGLRELQILNLPSLNYVFPEFVARGLLELEQLAIHNCNLEAVIVKAKDIAFQKRVKKLQEIEGYSFASTEDDHFHNEQVIEFRHLCSLKLKNLPHMTGFCSKGERGIGGKVSFPNLTTLELHECRGLKYVFTTSIAKNLMQLVKLEISNCEFVEEIIKSEEFEERIRHKIIFFKLDYLSLEKLPNLKKFGCGYPIEFPSVTELKIEDCYEMENFVSKFPHNGIDECIFNEMVAFSNLERMEVSRTNKFRYLWNEQFGADDSFSKLKALRVGYCSKLLVIFPSNIRRRFHRLETLHLYCCPRVEEIYQYEGINFEQAKTVEAFGLQDLEIWNLPSLKHIWSNYDPPRASTFRYLQLAKIHTCKDLNYVFPKSIACGLSRLQRLKISNCHVEVIIAKAKDHDEHECTVNFRFPQLRILQLENLKEMRSLYDGGYTFGCPTLKRFEFHGCDQLMKMFASEISAYRQKNALLKCLQVCVADKLMKHSIADQQFLFFAEKFICNLEELTLDHEGFMAVQGGEFPVKFSKLEKLTLRCLEEESNPLLFDFLSRHFLEKLIIVGSCMDELFSFDGEIAPGMGQHNLRLEHLELVANDDLKKCSRFIPLFRNLQTLNIEFCGHLINITPSSASFRRLRTLNVTACSNMTSLVTSSAAETLVNLIELRVSECYAMESIVVDDRVRRTNNDMIRFLNLKRVELNNLPALNCFCSSNHDFHFPSLEEVTVKTCFRMKLFCGRLSTPKLKGVVFEDEKKWAGDLNTTMASGKSYSI